MILRSPSLLAIAFATSLLAVPPLFAQGPGGFGGKGSSMLDAAMMKLYGDVKAFTAKAEMHASGGQVGDMTMPMTMAFSEGNSRMEMDLTQAKSAMIPPQAAAQMKMMGMDKNISISRMDKKMAYVVYPGLQAYLEMAMPKEAAEASEGDFKITKTELGRETVDGHPCVKNKVTITDAKGKATDATTWNATDLKNFPIKTEMSQDGMKMVMTYKDVKFATPDAKQFEPPAEFKKCSNQQELMQAAMQKMQGK